MNGLITRLFCAECLPFARTANYGCSIWVRVKGSNKAAVFLLAPKAEEKRR